MRRKVVTVAVSLMGLLAVLAALGLLARADGTGPRGPGPDEEERARKAAEQPWPTQPAVRLPAATSGCPKTRAVELAPSLAPPTGVLFGASVGVGSADLERRRGGREDFERAIGRCLDIVHTFYPWWRAIDAGHERRILAAGQIPLVSWNGTSVERVLSGSEDRWIAAQAARVRDAGGPVLLRWFWEMDGQKAAAQVGSPEAYQAAWRRIHDVFTRTGATNARWVWCPNAFNFDTGYAQHFYPGDDVVDWVCADGYAFPGDPRRDRSFADAFDTFYEWAEGRGKPVMIGEFGVESTMRVRQAQWLDDVRRVVQERYPRIKALVYWNSYSEDADFRIDGCPVLGALVRLTHDPYYDVEGRARTPGRQC